MLVSGARSLATTAAGTGEAENWMVVGERWNLTCAAATRTLLYCGRRHEPPATPTSARKVTALNHAPDGGSRHAERPPDFIDGDHLYGHSRTIVSQLSHCLNRLTARKLSLLSVGLFHRGHPAGRLMAREADGRRLEKT